MKNVDDIVKRFIEEMNNKGIYDIDPDVMDFVRSRAVKTITEIEKGREEDEKICSVIRKGFELDEEFTEQTKSIERQQGIE